MNRPDLARLYHAWQKAKEMKGPSDLLDLAGGNRQLLRDARHVAVRVNNDMIGAAKVMKRSSLAMKTGMTAATLQVVPEALDPRTLELTDRSVKDTTAVLLDARTLIELGKFGGQFPGLPFDEQARLLGPLARGEVLLGVGDPIVRRLQVHYHAEGLNIPPVMQYLAQVPAVRAMFAYASDFAWYFIYATNSFNEHCQALSSIKGMNEKMTVLANDLAQRFPAQEQARLESFKEISGLLTAEEMLLTAAKTLSKDEDRSAIMVERAKVINDLSDQMSRNTRAELETMEADARMLQILGVQLDSEKVRSDLFKQIWADYRLIVTAHRAVNTTLTATQRYLMGATLAVRQYQVAYIGAQVSELNDVYGEASQEMQNLLTGFDENFVDINGDGKPDNFQDVIEGDIIEG